MRRAISSSPAWAVARYVTGGAAAANCSAQRLLPDSKVVAAFHHLSAKHLADLTHSLEGDVLLCGDDEEAKATAMELVRELLELRPVDAGDLPYASVIESITAMLMPEPSKVAPFDWLRTRSAPVVAVTCPKKSSLRSGER